MKSSHNLFHLIKSLTKAEKRYFTIGVLQQSGNKNYSKLFAEIESQIKNGNYDEALIKARLKNEKFIKSCFSCNMHGINGQLCQSTGAN